MVHSMQNWPLLTSRLIEHAATVHGDRPIVTATVEGGIHSYNWRQANQRAKKWMQALKRLGVKQGDRVGTLAWNTHRHLEVWYGASGMGAVAHTINPRLFDEQITHIINHAQDDILLFDLSFVEMVERLAPSLQSVQHFVLLTDRLHMPENCSLDLLCYEELVEAEQGDVDWPVFDENLPSGLCYTSGTTGNPKGVQYTHRSTVLHSMAIVAPDAFDLSSSSAVMPIVPMYHVNAWGIPYAAAAQGAKLVLNGPNFGAKELHGLIKEQGVSLTAAVPTVFLGLLEYLRESRNDLDSLQTLVVGGSAAPRSMIEELQNEYGVEVRHAWGMTEMSPLGTVSVLPAEADRLSVEERMDIQLKQGRPIFGVELKITDPDGQRLDWDGESAGNLKVRGPWVLGSYFHREGDGSLDAEGYFDTGDLALISPQGYMKITDREKDVIKSGGEWISSIDLENTVLAHPHILEAAVIAMPHPKWEERPLLLAVAKEDTGLDKQQVLDFLDGKIARWWTPDEVLFIDGLPHTATGKVNKRALKEQYGNL